MSQQGESSTSSSSAQEQRSDNYSFDLSVFHAAIKKGNVSLVKTLLKTKLHGSARIDVEIWGKDKRGSTALHMAAAKGREEILDMLLDLHPDVNVRDGHGKTALNLLSEVIGLPDQFAVHIVKRFLEGGADPRIPSQDNGSNCLHTAASVGNLHITRCLLDPQIYGSHTEVLVDINAVEDCGQTALHLAADRLTIFGSVIIIAVSPPGGDFYDPITAATLGIVQVFWGSESGQETCPKKTFSICKLADFLLQIYQCFDPDFISVCTETREILQREYDPNEIVELAGKDALAESDKIILEVAKPLCEDYLLQNSFTP
ncbi:hypothetical protein R1sor_012017 [Riccia sorocarpa]|uniref:H(+)-transporting two-sector ATPase n=1 Tax=Riccia sorocarpa TaxID=122646 RepID=A0ABD3I3H9_9MARC